MALKRMDNVGIVVESLDAAISFFAELGLELEGRAMVEGEWAGRVTGLGDQRVEIAMVRTPDGHSRLELSRFITPPVVADHRNAPVNALGYLRVMFAVDDIDETLVRLRKHGAELESLEVVQYQDAYRLCYIRGPEGLLIGRLVMSVKRRVGSEGWKSIRCVSKATPARPYACRFSSVRRWRKPSVGPLLHARVSPACTADSSLCRWRAHACSSGSPCFSTSSSHPRSRYPWR